ncbi:unnamed protein product, partial [Ectocarpus sp. 12 AP-2014]
LRISLPVVPHISRGGRRWRYRLLRALLGGYNKILDDDHSTCDENDNDSVQDINSVKAVLWMGGDKQTRFIIIFPREQPQNLQRRREAHMDFLRADGFTASFTPPTVGRLTPSARSRSSPRKNSRTSSSLFLLKLNLPVIKALCLIHFI